MLYDEIKKNHRLPFHMPGHKRNTELLGNKLPYDLDLTEIEGFDDLHSPDGVIKAIEVKAKELYNSDNSFALVNGSTVGILAGVASVLKRGDVVLIARNCHKSVYNAIDLIGAIPRYFMPDLDNYGICKAPDPYKIKDIISEYHPKLIVVTSPTYEGVHSDIASISNIAHSYNIPVMVDSAHGAHIFDEVKYADITVMSLHKTLPALTQCAVAHINGDLVSPERYRNKLSVFETSSPSYVLMSSIEECLDFINNNRFLFERLKNSRKRLINNCSGLKHLKVFEYDDITKLIVFTGYSDITGIILSDKLRKEYNIEVEMSCRDYVVLITTICDDFDTYDLLYRALTEIDNALTEKAYSKSFSLKVDESVPLDCSEADSELVSFENSCDLICAEYVWAYPPGIPIIAPGERISKEMIEYIIDLIDCSVNIQSTYGKLPQKISIIKT